jgi:hypothetical protein
MSKNYNQFAGKNLDRLTALSDGVDLTPRRRLCRGRRENSIEFSSHGNAVWVY